MIDLNKIRSLKMLETIKADLMAFLANPDILSAYEKSFDWSEDDYEADKELVEELLAKVEHRIASLSRFLKGQAKKQDLSPSPDSEPATTPDSPQ